MSNDNLNDDLDDLVDDDLLEEDGVDTNGTGADEQHDEPDASDEPAEGGTAADAGGRIGGGLATALGGAIAFVTSMASTFVYTLTKFLPFIGEKFWKSAIETCTLRYQKASGADVVNFCHREAGKIEPIATNWKEGEDIGEKPGWKAVGEDTVWDPAAEGRGVERLGKADVILTDEAAYDMTDPLEMRVAEALDLEKVEPVLINPRLNQTIVTADGASAGAGAGGTGNGQAVADGGAVRQSEITLDPMQMDGFDDYLIDLAPDHPEADGMRISARKYKEMDLNKTSAEEMKNQETRGFLAGSAGEDNKGLMLKVFGIAVAFILLWEFGPAILSGIFGDSVSSATDAGGNLGLMVQTLAMSVGVF
jgi:hypothetical protein